MTMPTIVLNTSPGGQLCNQKDNFSTDSIAWTSVVPLAMFNFILLNVKNISRGGYFVTGCGMYIVKIF